MEDVTTFKEHIKSVFNRYSSVSDELVNELFSIASINTLKKGDVLLQIGTISKDIHIIYKGTLVSCYINANGDVYHKNIFLEGHFAGSLVSALTNKPSEFALEAITTNVTLISLDFKKFKELLNTSPNLKDFYIAYLEKNWVIDKEQREIDIVTKEATERYLNFLELSNNAKDIPLHYIASHLGITPTQLSRIRKKLKENS